MTRPLRISWIVYVALIAVITASPAFGQGARGGGRGMMSDDAHAADMQVFHQLFEHRNEITRRVVMRPDGIETVTESMNPDVRRLLQTHIASMLARVKDGRAIHRRDPLFAELFRYADQISAEHELTANGIRVVETSQDAYVVRLLQAHAEVVSAFITNGPSEMMRNHPVPGRPQP